MMDSEDSKAGMASPDLQKQLADLTQNVEMQVQAMTLQSQMMSTPGMSSRGTLSPHSQHTCKSLHIHNRQVKVPEGQYNMNPGEFRTYRKDCLDHKKFTQFTNDEQVVSQT